jgi:hypothetical protein
MFPECSLQLREVEAMRLVWPSDGKYGSLSFVDGMVLSQHPRQLYKAGIDIQSRY